MFYVMIHDQILIIDNSQQHLHQYLLFCCKILRGAATLIVFRLNVNLRRVPRGSILIEKKKAKEKCQEWKVSGFLIPIKLLNI